MGIYAASQGLNVTGNNITNINTEGYTRQTLDQFSVHQIAADRYQDSANLRMGGGVFAPSVSQDRDQYLDIRYRNQTSNVGYMDGRVEGLEYLSSLLDEVTQGEDESGVMEAMFNQAIDRMDELISEGAGKDQADGLFRAAMGTLVRQINKTAVDLDALAETQANRLNDDLDQVNKILTEIRDLNNTIRKNSIYGDNSLEMKDVRNTLLDRLSEYMQIDVTYTMEQITPNVTGEKLVVKTGTEPQRMLIDGLYCTQLSIREGSDVPLEESADGTDPNYDLDMSELRDTYNKRMHEPLDEGDRGVIKNRDAGAIQANGEIYIEGSDTGTPLYFESSEDAQKMADELNETAAGSGTEYRVQQDQGFYTVHLYTTTTYATSEDADNALIELKTNLENFEELYGGTEINSKGEVRQLTLKIVEESGHFEIHQVAKFWGEVQTQDTELGGKLLADREVLTEKGVFATREDLDRDADAAGKRGVPFYRKALDVLANSLATYLNDANQLPDETIYQMADIQSYDENGAVVTTREFVDESGKIVTGDKSKYVLKPEYSYYNGGVLLSNKPDSNDDFGINARNISISKNWDNGSFRVLRTKEPQDLKADGTPIGNSTANDNLTHIRNILTGKHQYTTNTEDVYEKAASSEVFFTGSFQELLTDHIASTLANDSNYAAIMQENWSIQADNLYVDRDGVQGVDLNDETLNMMRYEKSYSAACRLMTIFDEMLDKLINGTAV